jgi:serine protease Do
MKAGLNTGDVITAVDGRELTDQTQLRVIIANHLPGETVRILTIRDQKPREFTVTLGRLPLITAAESPSATPESSMSGLGLSLSDVTRSALRAAGIETEVDGLPTKGVLVANIEQSSDAFRDAEVRRGDIITEVNKQPVSGLAEFERIYKSVDSGEDMIIKIARTARGQDGFEVIGFITALRKP